ncbi:MAG: hypothetical protein RSB86_09015 [Comamonas sp.]|uniref:hypothetical protein n=1 Tax=Comamonas sp. TaxID=34028 RepID=UPI002FC6FD18
MTIDTTKKIESLIITDQEICTLAMDVIESIRQDFNNVYYKFLGGELKVLWSNQNKFNAKASSSGDLKSPPDHSVTLYYATAIRIYRDGEDLYDFVSSRLNKYSDLFEKLNLGEPSCLFKDLEKEHFVKNFFFSGLTYLFGHEIGHLVQEHSYIRRFFCDSDRNLNASGEASEIEEIEEIEASASSKQLTRRQSLIWHVTELAADHEAITWCLFELVRQAQEEESIKFSQDDWHRLKENTLIFSCAASCVHFRFNGVKAVYPDEFPIGTHPHPMLRIEKNVFQIISGLEFFSTALGINSSKAEISKYINKGVISANIFWIEKYFDKNDLDSGLLMLGGVINNENTKKYMGLIVNEWEIIRECVESIKRYKPFNAGNQDLGLMFFDENFKKEFTK